ncbi:hypothetical protein [Candidatus Nitrososphaera sp. FF02]|uniref:hypothetical protein n=1 Tax=Candidatus Nitrososphaera sp. FF02 TaxID=3398226 RepID=UPI0039EC8C82
MHFVKVEKSPGKANLTLYDSALAVLESEDFSDLYTLNFHLQTLGTKYRVRDSLVIVHDREKNTVQLATASDENSLFVS